MTDYTIRARVSATLPNGLRSFDLARVVSDVCANVIRCLAQTEPGLDMSEAVVGGEDLAAMTAVVMELAYEQAVEVVGGQLHQIKLDVEENDDDDAPQRRGRR